MIETWTSRAEARELARLAAGKTVLEIGAYHGFTTVAMAQAGAIVWSLDWHRGDSGGDPGLGRQSSLCQWWRNLERHGVQDAVVGLVGRSEQVLPHLDRELFDMVFIDADHSYESVRTDIELAVPLVDPDGGLVVFHDYSPVWPAVVAAVDDWRRERPFRLVESLAVVTLERSLPASQ